MFPNWFSSNNVNYNSRMVNTVIGVVRTLWFCLYYLDESGPNSHPITICAHIDCTDPCSSATCKSFAVLGLSGTLRTLCCFDMVQGAIKESWVCPHCG